MGAYDELVRLLPNLSAPELLKLRQRIDGFLQVSGGSVTGRFSSETPNFEEDWLLDGLHFELRRRGLWGDNKRLPRILFPSGYDKTARSVRLLLLKHNQGLRSAEHQALGRLAARALADHIEKIKMTVSPKLLLSMVSRIPVAIDDAFPGYLVAGLLPVCWSGLPENGEYVRG